MKKLNNTTNATEEVVNNPEVTEEIVETITIPAEEPNQPDKEEPTDAFVLFNESITEATRRSIPGANELNSHASVLASALLRKLPSTPELVSRGNKMLNGEFVDILELIEYAVDPDELYLPVLEQCTADELDRLLESRRSDRSKAKKLGIRNAAACLKYVAASIAEVIVRKYSGKAYVSQSALDVDDVGNDQNAINRKIRSLQSKVSNLKKAGQFAPADWDGHRQLTEVRQQIAELQARRVSNGTVRNTTVKSISQSDIKQALVAMTPEELEALLAQAKLLQKQDA